MLYSSDGESCKLISINKKYINKNILLQIIQVFIFMQSSHIHDHEEEEEKLKKNFLNY